MHSNTGVCRACSSLHRTACRQVQPFLGALVQKAHVSDETYGARSDCTQRMLATFGGPARPMAITVRADAALSTARRWSRSLIVVSVQHAPAVLAQSRPLKWRPSGSVSRRYQLKSARCDWRWVCAAVRRHAWAGHLLAAPSRTTISLEEPTGSVLQNLESVGSVLQNLESVGSDHHLLAARGPADAVRVGPCREISWAQVRSAGPCARFRWKKGL